MPKIAISYRRADSRAIVGRMFDHLVEHYGENEIFMDIDSIPFGVDFRAHIDGILRQIDILIVVVGPHWLGRSGSEPARILDPNDPVGVEVHGAFSRSIRILPVLVEDAKMPPAGALPENLKQFAFINALNVDAGRDFKYHMSRLIAVLDELLGKTARPAAAEAGTGKSGPVAAAAPSMRQFSATHEQIGTQDRRPFAPVAALTIAGKYLVLPAIALVLAHYLIVMKFNLDLRYLRAAAIVVPMLSGFMLVRQEGRSFAFALLTGVAIGAVAVPAMHAVVAMIDRPPLLPSTPLEWQEALEFLASIVLGGAAGALIARTVQSGGMRNRWRIGS